MDWAAITRSRHITRAFFMAVMMVGFLIWWKLGGDPGPVESEKEVAGVVEEVFESGLTVRLEDGRKVKVFKKGEPVVGSGVKLLLTRYANGDEMVVLMDNRGY